MSSALKKNIKINKKKIFLIKMEIETNILSKKKGKENISASYHIKRSRKIKN